MRSKEIEKAKFNFLDLIRSVKGINIIVIIVFFFAWFNLLDVILSLDHEVLILGFGLILPFVFLIGVTQYKSIICYMSVLSVLVFSVLINLHSLQYYAKELLIEYHGGFASCSCCPICEVQEKSCLIIISLLAISLMHNRRMIAFYEWDASKFYKLLIGVIVLFLLRYIL